MKKKFRVCRKTQDGTYTAELAKTLDLGTRLRMVMEYDSTKVLIDGHSAILATDR